MTTLITHPDNLEELKQEINAGLHDYGPSLFSIRVQTNPHMEKYKLTGRYILPDGRKVERDQISVEYRFVTFGPEDVELLLFAKVISEEREALFYLIEDSHFKIRADFKPFFQPEKFVYQAFG